MTIEVEEEEDTCEEETDFETWDEDEAAIEDDFDSFFEILSESESVAARRAEEEPKWKGRERNKSEIMEIKEQKK